MKKQQRDLVINFQRQTLQGTGSLHSTFLNHELISKGTPSNETEYKHTNQDLANIDKALQTQLNQGQVVQQSQDYGNQFISPSAKIKLLILKTSENGSDKDQDEQAEQNYIGESIDEKQELIKVRDDENMEQSLDQIQYEPKLNKNQSIGGGVQFTRFGNDFKYKQKLDVTQRSAAEILIQEDESSKNYTLETERALLQTHANSSAQLLTKNQHQVMMQHSQSTVQTSSLGNQFMTTTQATSKRQFVIPSTAQLDLATDTYSNQTGSGIGFSAVKKQPMATLAIKRNPQQQLLHKQQATGNNIQHFATKDGVSGRSIGEVSAFEHQIKDPLQSLVVTGTNSIGKKQRKSKDKAQDGVEVNSVTPIEYHILQMDLVAQEVAIDQQSSQNSLQLISEEVQRESSPNSSSNIINQFDIRNIVQGGNAIKMVPQHEEAAAPQIPAYSSYKNKKGSASKLKTPKKQLASPSAAVTIRSSIPKEFEHPANSYERLKNESESSTFYKYVKENQINNPTAAAELALNATQNAFGAKTIDKQLLSSALSSTESYPSNGHLQAVQDYSANYATQQTQQAYNNSIYPQDQLVDQAAQVASSLGRSSFRKTVTEDGDGQAKLVTAIIKGEQIFKSNKASFITQGGSVGSSQKASNNVSPSHTTLLIQEEPITIQEQQKLGTTTTTATIRIKAQESPVRISTQIDEVPQYENEQNFSHPEVVEPQQQQQHVSQVQNKQEFHQNDNKTLDDAAELHIQSSDSSGFSTGKGNYDNNDHSNNLGGGIGEDEMKSRNNLDMMKKLFGDSNAECRDIINELENSFARRKISVTDQEAVKLSKRSKDVPVLDKTKYKINKTIIEEAQTNPVLVKLRPLKLPNNVMRKLIKKKNEQARMYRIGSPSYASTSQKVRLFQNNQLVSRAESTAKKSSTIFSTLKNVNQQASPIKVQNTPIISGQHQLVSNKSLNKVKNSVQKSEDAESAEKELQNTRISRALLHHKNKRQVSKEKFLDEMRETRLIQNALQTVYKEERRSSLSKDKDDSQNSQEKLALVSQYIVPNHDERDKIIGIIQDEHEGQYSSNKQTSANRIARSIAKQTTWKSVTSKMQKNISESAYQSSKQWPTTLSNNQSKSSFEQVIRLESSQRRRTVNRMNEKVRIKNMEAIYKLKPKGGSTKRPSKRQITQRYAYQEHQSSANSSMIQMPQIYTDEVKLESFRSNSVYDRFLRNTYKKMLNERSSEYSDQIVLQGRSSSLPSIQINNVKNANVLDELDQFQAYHNSIRSETGYTDETLGENNQIIHQQDQYDVPLQNQVYNIDVAGVVSQDVYLSRSSNSDEQLQVIAHTLEATNQSLNHYHQESLLDSRNRSSRKLTNETKSSKRNIISMADLIQKQAQDVYYHNQTNERFSKNRRGNAAIDSKSKSSKKTNASGVAPSASFNDVGQDSDYVLRVQGHSTESKSREKVSEINERDSSDNKRVDIDDQNIYKNELDIQGLKEIDHISIQEILQSGRRSMPQIVTAQADTTKDVLKQDQKLYRLNLATQVRSSQSIQYRSVIGHTTMAGKQMPKHHQLHQNASQSVLDTNSQSLILPQLEHSSGSQQQVYGSKASTLHQGTFVDSKNLTSFQTITIPIRKQKHHVASKTQTQSQVLANRVIKKKETKIFLQSSRIANTKNTDGEPRQTSSMTLMGVGDSSTDGASQLAEETTVMTSLQPIKHSQPPLVEKARFMKIQQMQSDHTISLPPSGGKRGSQPPQKLQQRKPVMTRQPAAATESLADKVISIQQYQYNQSSQGNIMNHQTSSNFISANQRLGVTNGGYSNTRLPTNKIPPHKGSTQLLTTRSNNVKRQDERSLLLAPKTSNDVSSAGTSSMMVLTGQRYSYGGGDASISANAKQPLQQQNQQQQMLLPPSSQQANADLPKSTFNTTYLRSTGVGQSGGQTHYTSN